MIGYGEAQQRAPYETVSTDCSACQLTCNGTYTCGEALNPTCSSGVPSCQCNFLNNGAVIDQCGFCSQRCAKCYSDECPGGICSSYSYFCNNVTQIREDHPVCLQTTTTNPCATNPSYCGDFTRRCVFQYGQAMCQYIDRRTQVRLHCNDSFCLACEAVDCGPGQQCTYIVTRANYPDYCGCWEQCDYIPTCVPSP
uniref:VWFC domain-containing protein n=1 Tax=Steinernema glaseri TaxID=37863 RepID=A0A1I7YE68_9BILA